MSNNICFITGFFPDSIYKEIIKNSKYNIQSAADKLQKSLLEGLLQHDPNIYVINLPFVGSYPVRYKKIIIPSTNFDNINGESLSFINVFGLKAYFRKYKLFAAVQKWIKQSEGEKVLIVYSMQSSFIEVLTRVKKMHSNVKIVLIIPDLVQFMGGPSGFLYRLKRQRDSKLINLKLHLIDAYILLTENMIDTLPYKPYKVIEGMVSTKSSSNKEDKFEIKTVLYSGSLSKKYGIMNLIKSFEILDCKNVQLMICGTGDCEDEIKNIAKNNSNIIYKGILKHEDVAKLQRRSHLLVNPRTPEGEYTKYSFPSKIMEYFQSGTPVLLYKLSGIPEEYYNYCFSIEIDYSSTNLANKIQSILEMDAKKLEIIGEKAKEFVEINKNAKLQCGKLMELIEII